MAPMPKLRTDGDLLPATVRATFQTELGWFAAAATEDYLLSLVFAHRSAAAARDAIAKQVTGGIERDILSERSRASATAKSAAATPGWFAGLCRRLIDFASGAADEFSDAPLFTSRLTDFDQSVVRACRRIPYGETLSYGELAKRAGHAGAARGVGRTMATNRFPIIVPCHRVVAAGGRIGGYSAPQGLTMKRRLLALEAAEPPTSIKLRRIAGERSEKASRSQRSAGVQ